MIPRFAEWLVTHQKAGWLIVAGLSVAAWAGFTQLEFDDDLRTAFSPTETTASFGGSDDVFICLVSGEGLFNASTIGSLREFDFGLREVAGIGRVSSIFDVRSQKEVEGYRPPLMPSDNPDEASVAALLGELEDHPAVRGVFLGKSGNVLLFAAEPDPGVRLVEDLVPIQKEIERLLADLKERTGLTTELTGAPVLRVQIVETTRREQMLFSGGGAILGALIALLVFRRIAVLAITFPVPLVAAGWTMGAMGLAGEPINVMNNMIPVLIMVIALTDTTHLVYAIRRHAASGKSPGPAACAGLSEVGRACFMTSLTAATADASLAFSSNALVSRFGLACAGGTILVFFAVILVVPLLSCTFLGKHLLPKNAVPEPGSWSGFAKIAALVSRFPRSIGAFGLLVTISSGIICFQLDFDYRYRENLDTDSKDFLAIDTLDREFGGSQPLSMTATWPDGKTADEAGLNQVLEEIHHALEIPEWTGRAFSIRSLIDAFDLESEVAPVRALITEAPEGAINGLLDEKNHSALVNVPLRDAGSQALFPVLDEIERKLREIETGHPGYQLRLVGLTAASVRTSQLMISELAIGLFTAAFAIFGMIGLFLRSFELGLKSILPNLCPMVAAGAGLVAFGLPIQYISAIALSLCLGVAVDDTIHILFHFRENRRKGLDPEAAVAETLTTVGASLVTSTAILIAGFALLQISSLPTVRLFSWLAMLTLAAALFAELCITPAFLLIRRVKSGGSGRAKLTIGADFPTD